MDTPGLEELLDRSVWPVGCTAEILAERVVLRIPVVEGLGRYVIPSASAVGALIGIGVMVIGAQNGWLRHYLPVVFTLALLWPVVFAGLGVAAHTVWAMIQVKMVREIELTPHRITLVGPLQELWRCSLHEIDEVWASSDLASAVLGVRARAVVHGFRVYGDLEACWLRDVLRAWHARHARRGFDPDFERVSALGAKAASQVQ